MKPALYLFLLLLCVQAQATHLLGGYIRATPVAGQARTYAITALFYTDPVYGTAAIRDMNTITICMGDGTMQTVNRKGQSVLIANGLLATSVFETTYTYPGASTYTITTAIANRSLSVNGPANADQSLFTLATTFTIGSTGLNQTPVPVTPETNFIVGLNQRSVLSLRATDADGDSLVYRLAQLLTSPSTVSCSGSLLTGYTFPNDVTKQGTFVLNSRTGELVWTAPVRAGRYNTAIYIDEYRNGINISRTLEEITMIAEDRPGTTVAIPAYESATTSGIVTAVAEPRDASLQLSVFPNPVEENLQVVVLSNTPASVVVQLLDANGRQLHRLGSRAAVRRHEQVIGMGSLSTGTYLIRADVAGRILTEKVVKK